MLPLGIFFYNIIIGFSFGSVIARSMITDLWGSPLNTAKILSDNVTCIIFGPVAAESYRLHKAPAQLPLMKTIHAFYIKDDVVPKLSFKLGFKKTMILMMVCQFVSIIYRSLYICIVLHIT